MGAGAGFAGGFPSVLGMHVKDEVDGSLLADNAGENDAGEEGFAGAGFAKDAVAALDEAIEVDADGYIHIDGATDGEIAAVGVVFPAEDSAEVALAGVVDLAEVAGDGFDGQQL